jgi:hypothetical protein
MEHVRPAEQAINVRTGKFARPVRAGRAHRIRNALARCAQVEAARGADRRLPVRKASFVQAVRAVLARTIVNVRTGKFVRVASARRAPARHSPSPATQDRSARIARVAPCVRIHASTMSLSAPPISNVRQGRQATPALIAANTRRCVSRIRHANS